MHIRIVLQLCDTDAPVLHLTLPPLLEISADLLVITDRVTDGRIKMLIQDLPQQSTMAYRDGIHHWYEAIATAYELGDASSPDWILIADGDEILPTDHLSEIFAEAEKRDFPCIAFPHIYCCGDIHHVYPWQAVEHASHGKFFRSGLLNLNWSGGGGGCNLPDGYHGRTYGSPWPLRHLYCMTPEIQETRRRLGRALPKCCDTQDPVVLEFHGDWKLDRYSLTSR